MDILAQLEKMAFLENVTHENSIELYVVNCP